MGKALFCFILPMTFTVRVICLFFISRAKSQDQSQKPQVLQNLQKSQNLQHVSTQVLPNSICLQRGSARTSLPG